MNLIQSVSFVSSTTESLRIPSHVLEAAHYFKEYCYEEIHFIIICHHWTLKIGISWRFTEHFAAVFSACRVSTQLPGVIMLCIGTVLCTGTGVVWRGWVYSRSGLGSHGKVREGGGRGHLEPIGGQPASTRQIILQ